MGSSMVTILTDALPLMWSIMEARSVDLPLPVVPVTRIRPRFFIPMSRITFGKIELGKRGNEGLDGPDGERRGPALAARV